MSFFDATVKEKNLRLVIFLWIGKKISAFSKACHRNIRSVNLLYTIVFFAYLLNTIFWACPSALPLMSEDVFCACVGSRSERILLNLDLKSWQGSESWEIGELIFENYQDSASLKGLSLDRDTPGLLRDKGPQNVCFRFLKAFRPIKKIKPPSFYSCRRVKTKQVSWLSRGEVCCRRCKV